MTFSFDKNLAIAGADCSVEDALPLLEFIVGHPNCRIDLAECTRMHTAVFQVLLALRPKLAALPNDESLSDLLQPLPRTEARKRGKLAAL